MKKNHNYLVAIFLLLAIFFVFISINNISDTNILSKLRADLGNGNQDYEIKQQISELLENIPAEFFPYEELGVHEMTMSEVYYLIGNDQHLYNYFEDEIIFKESIIEDVRGTLYGELVDMIDSIPAEPFPYEQLENHQTTLEYVFLYIEDNSLTDYFYQDALQRQEVIDQVILEYENSLEHQISELLETIPFKDFPYEELGTHEATIEEVYSLIEGTNLYHYFENEILMREDAIESVWDDLYDEVISLLETIPLPSFPYDDLDDHIETLENVQFLVSDNSVGASVEDEILLRQDAIDYVSLEYGQEIDLRNEVYQLLETIPTEPFPFSELGTHEETMSQIRYLTDGTDLQYILEDEILIREDAIESVWDNLYYKVTNLLETIPLPSFPYDYLEDHIETLEYVQFLVSDNSLLNFFEDEILLRQDAIDYVIQKNEETEDLPETDVSGGRSIRVDEEIEESDEDEIVDETEEIKEDHLVDQDQKTEEEKRLEEERIAKLREYMERLAEIERQKELEEREVSTEEKEDEKEKEEKIEIVEEEVIAPVLEEDIKDPEIIDHQKTELEEEKVSSDRLDSEDEVLERRAYLEEKERKLLEEDDQDVPEEEKERIKEALREIEEEKAKIEVSENRIRTINTIKEQKERVEREEVSFEEIKEQINEVIRIISSSVEDIDKSLVESPKERGLVVDQIFSVDEVRVKEKRVREDGVEDIKALEIKGSGPPETFVTIFIFSEPIMVTVKTDSYGNWSYVVEKEMEDGQHEVYVASVDKTGKIVARSNPIPFVKEALAIDFGTVDVSPPLVVDTSFELNLFFVLIVVFVLIILIAIFVIGKISNK